jgi:lysophospholipase L1-like esterase
VAPETEAGTLIEVPLGGPDSPVLFRGALDLERTPAGLLPRRLPRWTRAQYPDPSVDTAVAMPSGVRLALRTAARTVELELLTSVGLVGDGSGPPSAGRVDLLVDGGAYASVAAPVGNVARAARFGEPPEITAGRPGTVRFAALPPGVKELELWLPQSCVTEVTALRADAPVAPPRPTGRPRWTHHGSSVSHGVEADSPTGTWPAVAAGLGGADLLGLGFAGNALLDPFTARTVRDEPADLVSLEIGINEAGRAAMRLRAFLPAVHGFLDTVREGHPDVPLLVVSPLACPALEHTPGPARPTGGTHRAYGDPAEVAEGALTLAVVRRELAALVEARRAAGDRRLHHLDGHRLLGPAESGLLVDGLHPGPAAHRLIGRRFAALAFGPGGAFDPAGRG